MTALDHKKKVSNLVKAIEDSDEISDRNRELILDFKRDLSLNEASPAWQQNLLSRLKVMAETATFDFDGATIDDLKNLVEEIQKREIRGRRISARTVVDYKKALKRFFGWLNGGEHPEVVQWIKTTGGNKNNTLPEDVLTEDEVQQLIDSTPSPRTKALIAVLWETGARIGEVIDLQVGDLRDHRHGLQIVIDGKTGQRRLPLISSIPQIREWLNQHPAADNRKAPLWAKFQQSGKGERVSYRYILKSLKKAGERAGIDKPMNPHHFRHSRATYLASKFTEAQMCEWFGWVQGSDVPAKYVHMSGRDIDGSYAKLHGLEDEEEPDRSKLAPVDCPRCGEKNAPTASFCQNCGQALSREAFEQIEEKKEMTTPVLEDLLEDPEFKEVIMEKIKDAVRERFEEDSP